MCSVHGRCLPAPATASMATAAKAGAIRVRQLPRCLGDVVPLWGVRAVLTRRAFCLFYFGAVSTPPSIHPPSLHRGRYGGAIAAGVTMDTNAKELVELLGEPNKKGGGNHRVSSAFRSPTLNGPHQRHPQNRTEQSVPYSTAVCAISSFSTTAAGSRNENAATNRG